MPDPAMLDIIEASMLPLTQMAMTVGTMWCKEGRKEDSCELK